MIRWLDGLPAGARQGRPPALPRAGLARAGCRRAGRRRALGGCDGRGGRRPPAPAGRRERGLRRRDAARDARLPGRRPRRGRGARRRGRRARGRAGLDVAGGGARHARRGAAFPRGAVGRGRPGARGGGGHRGGRGQQHGCAARAGNARGGDARRGGRQRRRAVGRGGGRAADRAVARRVLDGRRWPPRSAGQLAAGAGDLEEAREQLERAVVLARRGASRPDQIYALAALAPVQATIGGSGRGGRDAARRAGRGRGTLPSPGMFVHLVEDAERRLRGAAGVPRPPTTRWKRCRVARCRCCDCSAASSPWPRSARSSTSPATP